MLYENCILVVFCHYLFKDNHLAFRKTNEIISFLFLLCHVDLFVLIINTILFAFFNESTVLHDRGRYRIVKKWQCGCWEYDHFVLGQFVTAKKLLKSHCKKTSKKHKIKRYFIHLIHYIKAYK